ncbi:hypothetical protein JYU34_003762 [Plutella xylostella]|uniref:Peptidase M12B domain-containing protein n=1 Tax=Plutella xylostella TaxID=51655 RepID=A0ABQ7R0V1_PLUXY|nr:hypothetical protein JYU34_003762 [Plutella xylostella]
MDVLGRPYPSAGFTSVYILAHEIGHNLGMHHDGTGNGCARDGYIMSPSRGTRGEAAWSPCSKRLVAELEWATCLQDGGDDLDTPPELQHERFGDAPGNVWNAKKQCEFLLRDVDASPSPPAPSPEHCEQLACRSPHRAGFYYAGPALPGTPCGHAMACYGGDCVPSTEAFNSSTSPSAPSPAPWSPWQEGQCQSGCTARSKGYRERRRQCLAQDCEGTGYDVALCDDTKSAMPTDDEFGDAEISHTPTYRDILRSEGGTVDRMPNDNKGVNDNGFTTVSHKKRSKNKNMRGTLQSSNRLQVVEPACAIYVSRLMKHITEKDIREHFDDMNEKCLSVELLMPQRETSFNSFKVMIPGSKETWLLPHDLNFVNEIDNDFACLSTSSVDTGAGVLRGRPYGGLAL